jgi:hypothetical protein
MAERSMGLDVLDEGTVHHSPSIAGETSSKDQRIFATRDLVSLSVDELCTFRQELEVLLSPKIAVEITEIFKTSKTATSSRNIAIQHRRSKPGPVVGDIRDGSAHSLSSASDLKISRFETADNS